jgi:sialic acid synthase SpsE
VTFAVGGRGIGGTHPAYVVAEACDNHLGDLDRALEMARQAKLAGADAVKFQHHLPDEEMLPDVPMSANFNMPLYQFLKKYALTLDQHRQLKRYCGSIGIQYLCTPFSWKAAQELAGLGVEAYKIGSGELTDVPTLERIASLGRPMIVSTGMSTFEEVDRSYQMLRSQNVPLALMNCVSEYPPRYEDINLGVIPVMIRRYADAVIGHSDHTPDLFTSFAAVTLGAKIVEKHIILDKRQPGPDQAVSIDMVELAQLVEGIRKIEASTGSEKRVHQHEEGIRRWATRSLVATRAIAAGEIVKDEMIWSKRPGTGIPAHRRGEVIGRRAKRDIPTDRLLAWEDLEA